LSKLFYCKEERGRKGERNDVWIGKCDGNRIREKQWKDVRIWEFVKRFTVEFSTHVTVVSLLAHAQKNLTQRYEILSCFLEKVDPDEIIGFFNLPNPSSRTMALVSTQPRTEMSTRNLPGG
jgi:hypothetical protein